jgi:hypothetical protein
MRIVVLSIVVVLAPAVRAFEIASELSIGRDFVHQTIDASGDVVDGRLALGGGATMSGGFGDLRFGAHARVELRGARWSAAVAGSWAPAQRGRGWATVTPSGALHFERERVDVDVAAEVTLRRADAMRVGHAFPIDQLQARAQVDVAIDERWEAGAGGIVSFYDPDPAARALRGADLGLSITLAGRAERWAASVRAARRLPKHVAVEVGFAWVAYADGRGGAAVPRASIRAGPWRGVSVETSGDVIVGTAARDGVGGTAGVRLGYER